MGEGKKKKEDEQSGKAAAEQMKEEKRLNSKATVWIQSFPPLMTSHIVNCKRHKKVLLSVLCKKKSKNNK